MVNVEEIEKELKTQMDLSDFKTATEIYQNFSGPVSRLSSKLVTLKLRK